MHEDDRSRLVRRVARELASEQSLWFGEGLPETVRQELGLEPQAAGPVALAFVEVRAVSGTGLVRGAALPFAAKKVIGLSDCDLSSLGELIRGDSTGPLKISRLICPMAVFDFTDEGPLLREIRHGLTAADVQAELDTTLWSGPDLCELR